MSLTLVGVLKARLMGLGEVLFLNCVWVAFESREAYRADGGDSFGHHDVEWSFRAFSAITLVVAVAAAEAQVGLRTYSVAYLRKEPSSPFRGS